jgi:hypothetical protein
VPLTNVFSGASTMQFIDSGAANFDRRFYRALTW